MPGAFRRVAAAESVDLLTLDEAEMRVGLFAAPRRPGAPWPLERAQLTGPVFDAARGRMLARGLATDEGFAGAPGTLRPAGDWDDFLDHAVDPGRKPTRVVHRRGDTATVLRIVPGRETGPTPWVSLETLTVPAEAGEEPLPVDVLLVPVREAVRRIVATTFAGDGSLDIQHLAGTDQVDVRDGVATGVTRRRLGQWRRWSLSPYDVATTLEGILDAARRRAPLPWGA